jgi:hypothetical protein
LSGVAERTESALEQRMAAQPVETTLFPQSLSVLAEALNWDALPIVHKPALFSAQDPWYSYKYMSVVEALSWIDNPGDWAQFGVFRGATARVLESVLPPERKLHLFDSFDGLPESWVDGGWKRGHFKVPENEIPTFDAHKVVIHRGWFSSTVPAFRTRHAAPLAFLHIDSDLYSSAMDVLCGLNDLIVPGTVILFDELFMLAAGKVSDDECRALHDWAAKFQRRWTAMWRTRWVQAAIRVDA